MTLESSLRALICTIAVLTTLQVEFVGEEGMDAGGVQKEFFLLLLKDILNPHFGMFTEDDESSFIWFNDEVIPLGHYPIILGLLVVIASLLVRIYLVQ